MAIDSYKYDSAQAKTILLQEMRKGNTVETAMNRVGKTMKTWDYYRASDKAFGAEVDKIRAMLAAGADGRKDVPGFELFCEKYLGQKLFWHQLQWVDMMEGRAPRQMHPA